MPIRGIVFDLEGPLVDFEKRHFEAHCVATKKVLGVQVTYEWIVENIPHAIGGGDEVIATGIALYYEATNAVGELLKRKTTIFREGLQEQKIAARPESIQAVRWFHESGYQVAVGTNTPRTEAFRYLDAIGFTKIVTQPERIVIASEVGRKKPAPDVYLETARRLRIEPRHQLVFDDSPTGLQAARDAGSVSIATPIHRTRTAMEDVMREVPRRVIYDWTEVNLPSMMENLLEELTRR